MANIFNRRTVLRSGQNAKAGPVSKWLFWISMILSGLCAAIVLWVIVSGFKGDIWAVWIRILIVTMLAIFIAASLATTEIIPWGARSWAQWRHPKVLGTIVYLLLGAVGFVAGIAGIFDHSGAKQETLEKARRATESTGAKVDELTRILRAHFPDNPPILREIGGRWGDLEPACEVVWNIEVKLRGDKAALIAETVKLPHGVKPYRFVGEIIGAKNDALHVEGVEPLAAQGASARFEYNAATQRLTWDDRARGSAGGEVYRRCPSS